LRLSLVIPAYNEAQRLPETLRLAREYLSRQDYASEVIVMDDASMDDTAESVRPFENFARVVRFERNRGKGAAVRAGMVNEARGDYRFYFDADASTPIEMLDRAWPKFDAGADIVIGSRALEGADIAVRQVWYREEMGRMNNRLLRLLALTPYADTQCGFKGFTAAACGIVFPRQTIDRFSFDVELLYIAARHGLRIEEIPVRWLNSPDTRVHPIRDSARMIWDTFRIRARAWRGGYA
jgi:dolichyl-phosphate beta-glucosyltransferase